MRFCCFGDFGEPCLSRDLVVANLLRIQETEGLDFGILLGDNFYPDGLSHDAAQQKAQLLDLVTTFQCLDIPFYSCLGNHDYVGNTKAQIDFTHSSSNPQVGKKKDRRFWTMLDHFYDVRLQAEGGDIHLFFVDTQGILLETQTKNNINNIFAEEDEHSWQTDLRQKLATSAAKWKIVIGHHPIVSDYMIEYNLFLNELHQIIAPHAYVYLTGHDHSVQLLRLGGSRADYRNSDTALAPLQLISGACNNEPIKRYKFNNSIVRSKLNHPGFLVIDVQGEEMKIMPYEIKPEPSGRSELLNTVRLKPDKSFQIEDVRSAKQLNKSMAKVHVAHFDKGDDDDSFSMV